MGRPAHVLPVRSISKYLLLYFARSRTSILFHLLFHKKQVRPCLETAPVHNRTNHLPSSAAVLCGLPCCCPMQPSIPLSYAAFHTAFLCSRPYRCPMQPSIPLSYAAFHTAFLCLLPVLHHVHGDREHNQHAAGNLQHMGIQPELHAGVVNEHHQDGSKKGPADSPASA